MRSLGRILLLGLLILVALTYAVGMPRLWHAHRSADVEHGHSSANSQTAHSGHSHSHERRHSGHHSHGHHSHGHTHRHSHGPAHSHSDAASVDSEASSNENAVSAPQAAQWHLHVSLLGWDFTIWGSDVAPSSGHPAIAQQDDHPLKERSHRSRAPVEDGKPAVSAVDVDWLTHWDSGVILMPLRRSVIALPFDPSRHFAALDDESPDSADLQPPVPPPRTFLMRNRYGVKSLTSSRCFVADAARVREDRR